MWGISSIALAGIITWAVHLFAQNLREKDQLKIELIKTQEKKIAGFEETQEALRKSKKKLARKNIQLEEKTVALGEILEQMETEKQKISEQVIANVDTLLLPILQKMKDKGSEIDEAYLDLLEESLMKLTSPFGTELEKAMRKLTPREIEICKMIRNGLITKEISQILKVSIETIKTHRKNIRKKIDIKDNKTSLTAYLKSL